MFYFCVFFIYFCLFFNLINKFYLDFFTEPKRLKGFTTIYGFLVYVYGSFKVDTFFSFSLIIILY